MLVYERYLFGVGLLIEFDGTSGICASYMYSQTEMRRSIFDYAPKIHVFTFNKGDDLRHRIWC